MFGVVCLRTLNSHCKLKGEFKFLILWSNMSQQRTFYWYHFQPFIIWWDSPFRVQICGWLTMLGGLRLIYWACIGWWAFPQYSTFIFWIILYHPLHLLYNFTSGNIPTYIGTYAATMCAFLVIEQLHHMYTINSSYIDKNPRINIDNPLAFHINRT